MRRSLSYWLVIRDCTGPVEALVVVDEERGETLAVFCFREEAELFASMEAPGPGWCAREFSAGELISLLYGLCAHARAVSLDPLPRTLSSGCSPAAFGKREFVGLLIERQKVWLALNDGFRREYGDVTGSLKYEAGTTQVQ